jgi:TusA-related sulfurtransferase
LAELQVPDLLKQVGEVKKGGPILSRILQQLERGARLKLSLSCPLPFVTALLPRCHAADPGARPTFKDILKELGAAVVDMEQMDGSLPESTAV